ncbi:unnamed protein product [Nesidiocoris tenuis]|uniref:Uncharacterized protein n=1 Tax=Nesidiocoris tenuis TaxID=355587 RepID=A0A6H5GR73_9HEMI|nr:unnamed protein product [Nesidiocoris tenuis]
MEFRTTRFISAYGQERYRNCNSLDKPSLNLYLSRESSIRNFEKSLFLKQTYVIGEGGAGQIVAEAGPHSRQFAVDEIFGRIARDFRQFRSAVFDLPSVIEEKPEKDRGNSV